MPNKAFQELINWLRRDANESEGYHNKASPEEQKRAWPLVSWPDGILTTSISASKVGWELSAAARAGAFVDKRFDDVRIHLVDSSPKATIKLVEFLITQGYQLPGPVYADVRKIADALSEIVNPSTMAAKQAAVALGVSKSTVTRKCADGKYLGAYKGKDGQWMIPTRALDNAKVVTPKPARSKHGNTSRRWECAHCENVTAAEVQPTYCPKCNCDRTHTLLRNRR